LAVKALRILQPAFRRLTNLDQQNLYLAQFVCRWFRKLFSGLSKCRFLGLSYLSGLNQ
jgi:hypothetical protein